MTVPLKFWLCFCLFCGRHKNIFVYNFVAPLKWLLSSKQMDFRERKKTLKMSKQVERVVNV